MLQEFDLEIRDCKGMENEVADHLSRIQGHNEATWELAIKEHFSDKQLLVLEDSSTPWYADLVNFLVSGIVPPDLNFQQRKRFFHQVKHLFWDESYLYKKCLDQLLQRCVVEEEIKDILEHCHSSPCGGHFGGIRTATKVLQSGYYWPTIFKDA